MTPATGQGEKPELPAAHLRELVDSLAAKGHGLIMVMGKGGVGKTTIAAAVAIGLVTEAHLGEAAGITAPGTTDALRTALGGAGLPTRIPAGLDHGRLIDAMRADKKSRAGGLAFALLAAIGHPAGNDREGWSTMLEEVLVREQLQKAGG